MASSGVPFPRRRLAALLVAAAVFGPIVIAPDAGAAKNRFGVVVIHDNGDTSDECVELSAEKIRALDLLNRTSFDLYTQDFGGDLGRGVCWLDGEGYGPPACFGGVNDPYWGLYIKRPREEVEESPVGVSSLKVPAKSVIYLQFDTYPQPTPEKVSVRSICEAA